MRSKCNKERFIEEGKKIHCDKYDYSLIHEIKNDREKVAIICPEHGIFYKSFNKHISCQQGCPKCSGKFRYNTETFIEEIKKRFDCTNLTFEKAKYVNNKIKICVTCHEKDENGVEHGDFYITPAHMLAGQGCSKCRYVKSATSKRRTVSEIIEESNKVHENKYDYSLIKEYKNDRIKYPIICPIHGVYYQTFNNHIKGKQGCPKCGRIKCDKERTIPFSEFIEQANIVHNNKYEYDESSYNKITDYVKIKCPNHGYFYQSASNHVHLGHGCPKCANIDSDGENELYEYIKFLLPNTDVIHKDRKILDGQELDIYVPEKRIAFEYNGLYWHSELSKSNTYHLLKTENCAKNGIRLIHIFEDEWIYKKDIVKSVICNALNKTDNKIFARNCEIKEVSSAESKKFLNENHLQGNCPSSFRYGLFYNSELVSIMTFGKSRHFIGNKESKDYELLRFCNKINTNVIGGASKLFKFFTKTNPLVTEIVSYADKRWTTGNLYDKLGFVKYNESKPNYYYIIKDKRVYRFNLRKTILMKKYNCPKDMTEKEFCYKKHWYRIYDCGCRCYKWSK